MIEESAPLSPNSDTPTTLAPSDLHSSAGDPHLTEDTALALLKRVDLSPDVIEQLSKHAAVLTSRKVKLALVAHPHTPRHVSVPMARQLYTFDLMKVALAPGVPADVKVAVDEVLISRLKTITIGERLTLARRASGRVAAALLLDLENRGGVTVGAETAEGQVTDAEIKSAKSLARQSRVFQVALGNPRLTEALVINSVLHSQASAALVHAVARHAKWSCRREVRAALLRTEHLPLGRALEFSREVPSPQLQELLGSSRLPGKIKDSLLRENKNTVV